MEFKLILKKLNNTLSEEDATIFQECIMSPTFIKHILRR
ncbi:hypothetical protein JCM19274_75 [Algibacter lectus]|uniref:Uncharacterized protein n=1 Tax=Algibacter lectus TaxID=221126 RepID=A0A090X702_9FLAO|nr:hypothetical protein JCM19274_75 [Algibacter lectus]